MFSRIWHVIVKELLHFRRDRVLTTFLFVFPLVQLVMGYPAENPPPRPRYPLPFSLFEDEYPKLGDAEVEQAMKQMDEGYLAQNYYRKGRIMIRLEGDRTETFTYDDYSWTEHISRKWGQWYENPAELLKQLSKRGFDVVWPVAGKSNAG